MLLPLRSALIAAALLICSSAVPAQVALYANVEASDLRQTDAWIYGATFGLYDDFYKLGPLRIGENAGSLKGSYHVGYEVNGGVDLTFLPHLDWRVAEIGAGNFGSQTEKQFHIATGLVLRFF